MKTTIRRHILDTFMMLLVLLITFGISIILQNVFHTWEHITTLFVFSVFIISLFSHGYIYGIISAIIAVIAINYAFTYPYFDVDFSAPVSIVSAVVMLIIAVLTSALTTRLKIWQVVRSETEKERMRANLLRSVSHDLRTPLTTIYGASSSLLDSYDKLNDEQKVKMIQGIKEDSQWLIRIVENLLSITRIDSGRLKLLKSPVVLEELIDAVILKFKKRYPEIIVELDIPDDIVVIPMDAILIEQVIINILENAVQHAKGFSRLIFRVLISDKTATFEISDNGCGIPKEKLATIFTGYSNLLDSNTDTQTRNAGIGLSVCATIIKAHGGTISAKNAKNGGAVFRFTLNTEEYNEIQQ